MGNTHSTYTSFDATTPSYGFGYRYIQGNANGPGTGQAQFYSWYIGLGSEYPATGSGSYGAMFAVGRTPGNPYLSVRYNEGNAFGAWQKIYAGYADTAGSATTATSATSATSATTATTATNVAGGAAGNLHYQTGVGTTGFVANGTAGQALLSNGASAPSWGAVNASPSITAVASGALSNGTVVALNPDGTVSPINSTNVTTGTEQTFTTSTSPGYIYGVWDSVNQRAVIVYRDAIGGGALAIVASVSGTVLTFGTPVSIANPATALSISYDPVNAKVVVAYYDSASPNIRAVVGTVSGLSISFGTIATVSSVTSSTATSLVYDSLNAKTIISYNNSSVDSYTRVGTISGTTISFGVPTTLSTLTTSGVAAISMAYAAGKIVTVCATSTFGRAFVGTVSGTTISYSTNYDFVSGTCSRPQVIYDTGSQRLVISWIRSSAGYVRVASLSGTVITYNPTTYVYNYPVGSPFFPTTSNPYMTYYPDGARIVLSYMSSVTANTGFQKIAQIYDGDIVIGAESTYTTNISGSLANSGIYDSTNKQIIYTFLNAAGGNGISRVGSIRATTLSSGNYIGISNAAYAHAATATIQTAGAVDDAQTALAPGSSYFVTSSGAGVLATTAGTPAVFAGTATTATNFLVADSLPTVNTFLTSPTFKNSTEFTYSAGSSGTSFLVDTANGSIQIVSLNAASTFSFLNPVAGKNIRLFVRTTGVGSITWAGAIWPGGVAPTITATASRTDVFNFTCDGTNFYGNIVGQNYNP